MIPVFGVVVTIAGISLKTGAILQKLNQVIFDAEGWTIQLTRIADISYFECFRNQKQFYNTY